MSYTILSPRRLRQIKDRVMTFYPRTDPDWKRKRVECYKQMVAEEEALMRLKLDDPDVQELGFRTKMRSAIGWQVGAWAIGKELPRVAKLMRFKSANDVAQALTIRFPVLARRYSTGFQAFLLLGGFALIGFVMYHFPGL